MRVKELALAAMQAGSGCHYIVALRNSHLSKMPFQNKSCFCLLLYVLLFLIIRAVWEST